MPSATKRIDALETNPYDVFIAESSAASALSSSGSAVKTQSTAARLIAQANDLAQTLSANKQADFDSFGPRGMWWGGDAAEIPGQATPHMEEEKPMIYQDTQLRSTNSLEKFLATGGPKLKDVRGLPNSKRKLKKLRKERRKMRNGESSKLKLPSLRNGSALELNSALVQEAFAYTDKLRLKMTSESLMRAAGGSELLSASNFGYSSSAGTFEPIESSGAPRRAVRRKLRKKSSKKKGRWQNDWGASTSSSSGTKKRLSVDDLVENFSHGLRLQQLREELEDSKRSMGKSNAVLAGAMQNWVYSGGGM